MTLSAIQAEYGRVVSAAEAEGVSIQTLKTQTKRMRIMMANNLVVFAAKSSCFGLVFLDPGIVSSPQWPP
jgi:hypothetical protein